MPTAKSEKNSTRSFLLLPLIISIISGIFFVYNSSSTYAYENFGNAFYFLINQSTWILIGVIVFLIIQKMPLSLIHKLSIPLYFLALFFLVVVLIPSPFSLKVYGARRWLLINPSPFSEFPFLGRLGFQPSEMIKLLLCVLLPKVLLSIKSLYNENVKLLKYVCYLLVPASLVLLEPDLKNAFLIVFIGGCILFVAGFKIRYFVFSIPIFLFILLVVIIFYPYRLERVYTYLGSGDSQSSYHLRQINIALGSGGIFGVGMGQSRQKNEYLPEVVGDSIFAVIGEEFGFVGSFMLVLLLFLVTLGLYKSVRIIKSFNEKLTAVGVLSWYGMQVFLNLGAVSGVIPITGVPLPFISYGGSSLVFLLAGFALVYKSSKNS